MSVEESTELENLRIRVSPQLNDALDSVCKRKRLKKQDAIEGMLRWFVEQDGRLQSLIVGQIEQEFHGEIIDKVLDSLRHPPQSSATQARSGGRPKGK